MIEKKRKKTALLLGLHSHQPVDNFHHVVDDAIERSYYPFFEVASQYRDFKFSVHYSGWLLEYIRDRSPKTFSLMQSLSQNGQIEFLTGGFYEPILASISSRDRVAQIKKLNDFIEEYFNQVPKGLWLTERVWDSVIIKDLVRCGVEYVVVDDYHFISSGFDKDRLNGYFITEDEGETIKIFPINKELRYTIPFAKPDVALNYLEGIADSKISAGVIFDDGEKFGVWPQTYEWVYQKGWLSDFIEMVIDSGSVVPMLYRDYLETAKPISLAYLPITSYIEMGSWSLNAEDANTLEQMKHSMLESFDESSCEKFIKGSVWKNFLIKYPEANRIHKRYLALSNERLYDDDYLDSLYKAQTNDVLWHGVFGGIYLPNLRDNAYRFIIDCENIKYFEKKLTEVKDINLDGYDEVKCISQNLITIFDTKSGGQLVEFSIRDRSFNLQNSMSRYYESYHKKILEPNLEIEDSKKDFSDDKIETIHGGDITDIAQYRDILKHDWYTKNSFIDHIVSSNINLDNFSSSTFDEYGDFANQPYELISAKDQKISLKRDGGIYFGGKKRETTIIKNFLVDDESIVFDISIDSRDSDGFYYLLEHNFHFANLKDIKINSLKFDENTKIRSSDQLEIYDSYTNKTIIFTLSQKSDIFLARLDTVSQSESGFDITNQGLTIGFLFKISLETKIDGIIEVSRCQQ